MRFRFSQATITVILVGIFLIANRGAYQGYFSDDDLDNLASTMLAGFDTFWRGFGSPYYDAYNFRPLGHVVYRWMGQIWGLSFNPFVGLMQALHLLNAALVYRLILSALSPRAALAGAAFFAFHPALIAAHWKPMYIFDVLCAMALVIAFLLYRSGRWMVSLLFFWCAYKAKEVAIFFPLILVIEEWMGERRWARVAPFMAISLCFGSQALIANRGRPESAYTLHFTISALAECLRFYVRMGLGLPWAALAFWSWLSSEERRWLVRGSLASTVLIIPLVFLPGRLFSVYLYVPLIFGTVAIGAVTNRWPRLALTVAFIVYAGMGLRELRIFRKAELTQAPATREFVESAWVALKGSPTLTHAFYEGGPKGLSSWGVEGAIRLCHGNLMMKLEPWNISKISAGDAVVRWTKFPRRKGVVEVVRFDGELTGDWYAWDGSFRWMGERARMRIRTEPGDKRLSVDLVAAPADELELMVDGKSLGTRLVANHGAQTTTFELRDAEQKDRLIEVELRARPARRIGGDPRLLGLAVRTVRATP